MEKNEFGYRHRCDMKTFLFWYLYSSMEKQLAFYAKQN